MDRNHADDILYIIDEVALLAEGVDRNRDGSKKLAPFVVALLAEGVDRNDSYAGALPEPQVAPLAEGVDRDR